MARTNEEGPLILQVLVRAKPKTIDMLQAIFAPADSGAFAREELGAWLAVDISGPEAIRHTVEEISNAVDLAAGAMSLWANCRDRPRVTNLYYQDPETGRWKGRLLNAYSVVAPVTPESVIEVTHNGVPRGAAVISMAQEDQAVAKALSVLAGGGSGWWELYILLEILRDSLAKREGRSRGSWQGLFKILSERYGASIKTLHGLRQTINYHRHFHSELPAHPWEHGEAAEFIRTAIRDWIDGLLLSEDC